MNGNTNGFSTQSQGQYSQAHINPSMLASLQAQQTNPQFQKAFNGNAGFNPQMFQQSSGLNPHQLMNNARPGGGVPQQTLNPTMLLQQAHGGSNNQGGMNPGMNGLVNPSSMGMGSGGLGNSGMGMGGGMQTGAMGFTPEQLAQLQSMTPEQIKRAIQQPQQQQQMAMQQQQAQRQFNGNQYQNQQLAQQAAAQFLRQQQQNQHMNGGGGGGLQQNQMQQMQQLAQHQQQQQQQQQAGLQAVMAQQQAQQSMGAFYDRPSSSASASHSQPPQFSGQHSPHGQQFPLQSSSQFQMMPPPPPRPPSSRPGTSNSHNSHHSSQPPPVAAPHSPSLGGPPMQPPPSRPRTSSGFSPFGPQGHSQNMPKPPTPIQPAPPQPQAHTPTHAASPFAQPQNVGAPFPGVPSTPTPGSPGARKRKLTGPHGGEMQQSPQFGGMAGGLSMGMGGGGGGAGGLMATMPPGGAAGSTYLGGAGGGLMGPPHVVPSRSASIGLPPHPSDAQAPLLPQHPHAPAFPQSAPLPDMRQRQASLDAGGFADLPGARHADILHSPAVQAKAPPPPPLAGSAALNAKTTRVTLVAPADVPELADEEVARVQAWMARDKAYDALYRGMKDRMAEELRDVRTAATTNWWEVTDGRKMRTKFGVTYPAQRMRDSRKRGRREGFKLPSKVKPEDADRPELLVPIRLEFDVEHQKMRDTFVWNLNDPVITPEVFAQSIVDDYSLAPSYLGVITKSIQDQLSDFKAHTTALGDDRADADAQVLRGRLDVREEQWWNGWRRHNEAESAAAAKRERSSRKRRKMNDAAATAAYGSDADEKMFPASVADIELEEKDLYEEMRILIKLDIVVGSMKLEDQFEWDIDNPGASPEQFAEVYARELGLGGEFKTAIAHGIREQVQTYQKSLFLVGHPSDGTMVQDDDLRMSLLSPVMSGARSMDQVTSFTPMLNYLSDSELERTEKEREKEMNRRRKRNTRGRRGIALPDREPAKTFRTPAIGFPEVDPATLALQQAAAAPTSRRAAAAAASLTIANMVASENGTAVVTPTLPMATPAPMPATPKEKKTKGLFRAPSYPSSVLRPRAHVTAPTPSTAADASSLPPPLENDPPAQTPVAPPDSRIIKTISAKRAKELEREAKEKEFADGQHANMINGVWHCSNCGCPEDIAIGRRKGPLGDKSQCGTCGKFWHRHRRPMPVVYNSDPEYHLNLKLESERAKTYAKKKGGAAALRAAQTTPAVDQEASTPMFVEPDTPSRTKTEVWVDVSGRTPSRGRPPVDDERAISPVSSGSSSASEPILAQKMKMNGVSHTKAESVPPAPPASGEPASAQSPPNAGSSSAPPAADGLTSPSQTAEDAPPEWLVEARAASQREYPNDRFEVMSRQGPTGAQEWRLKCLDCPGKLYKPGDRNLSNFEVHLKNRQHRSRVNERMRREAAGTAESS